jgi:hypothetical protein
VSRRNEMRGPYPQSEPYVSREPYCPSEPFGDGKGTVTRERACPGDRSLEG